MSAPGSVLKFFKTVPQQVDVIAGDANGTAHKYFRNQKYQDLYNSSVAIMMREMQHEIYERRPLKTRFALIIVKIIIPSVSAQQMTLIVAS